MRIVEMWPMWTLLADITGWFLVHMGVSYLFFIMPDRWFIRLTDGKLPNSHGLREEIIYERYLLIRTWKDKPPDGGGLFPGGFAKKKFAILDKAYVSKFIRETRRGEWTHFGSMLPAPLFFMWNEPLYGWMMMIYAIIANVPFILIQRYNRIRLQRILRKLTEKSGNE
ncbi:glycosyl-4,4'-diaponeurosporenoate acyltransferase CrtO family protein [Paenibacillus alginolyticus]|uniref:Glycosyl-4,4'-diaponeurosporenoate acyltransferase n=1 Tax=Paenibacillus alginolyticus TaxID=59839 RepID=A0ABT4GLJ0_9BACL|nr:glycosyl-4,4'-diaponeurosporenoate acyltransferase [Paenibacillus alginolyticus]MCY9697072.1 glycosyl-4,4'-diaponeurosporenoate acyltransferase [Paenibacillus alginolyticus]MEC0146437.1 glycosyl-4,4'-diaponeurosporenoate acyltransferase [Paenibacillus alginolyticus]